MSKVLITGGTSFIAAHCIKLLLERGYVRSGRMPEKRHYPWCGLYADSESNFHIVATVRNHEKGKKLVDAYSASPASKLSYVVVEDVAKSGAFDGAVKSIPGFDFVIHTASPFHYNVQDPIKDFLEPAVTGTTSILQAVKNGAPSVKRVVITSSFAAINGGSDASPPLYDELSWNPITWDEAASDTKAAYRGSKTLAERAAWDFMEREKPGFDLVTINPSLVFGPAAPHLSSGELGSLNTSNVRILDMIQGKMKDSLAPTGFYTWVDARDVALAHIKALDTPDAAGKRFLLMAGYQSNKEIANIIANISPELKEKLPTNLDSFEEDIPGPNERYRFSNQRSIDVLGLSYTSLETSVKDTVDSLIKLGA